MQVLDETSYLFAQSLSSLDTPKFFRDNVLRALFEYQNKLNTDEDHKYDTLNSNYSYQRNGQFLNDTHKGLIKKFKNLEKMHESQAKFKGSNLMLQDMIEQFMFVANGLKEHEWALSQINVMKDFQER